MSYMGCPGPKVQNSIRIIILRRYELAGNLYGAIRSTGVSSDTARKLVQVS